VCCGKRWRLVVRVAVRPSVGPSRRRETGVAAMLVGSADAACTVGGSVRGGWSCVADREEDGRGDDTL
jgi:hypothetical protein